MAGRLGRGLSSGDTGMGGRGELGVRDLGREGDVEKLEGIVADFAFSSR